MLCDLAVNQGCLTSVFATSSNRASWVETALGPMAVAVASAKEVVHFSFATSINRAR